MIRQKKREEVDNKYKWDLTTIYKTDNEFLKELDEYSNKINEITLYSNNLMDNAENLYNCFKLDDLLSSKIDKLYTYAHLHHDEDTTNNKYQKYYGLVSNLYYEYSSKSSFILPSLMKYDYDKIEKFYEDYPKLKEEYEFVLKDIYRNKKHTLDENIEKVLSSINKAFDKSDEVYSILTNSDFTFDYIKDEKGNKVELTKSNYGIYNSSLDKKVRKSSFKTLYKEYKKYSNTLAKCLSNTINANISLSNIRNYDSALISSLNSDNIDTKIYDNLINTVENNLKPLFDYYNFKKKKLNLKSFHIYDIYAPILSESEKKYSFEDAKQIVEESLSILGEDYINVYRKAFNEKWIDVFNNKGKLGGAYSSGSYLTNPFLLLNYEGKLEDISTLAHEMGHSIHTYYSNKNNPYQYHDYKIFVAEVASTVNELLLANYMLKTSKDKKEKLNILDNLLELYKGTLFRQTMFARFEKELYESASNNEILTSEYISNKYYEILKKYFPKSVILDEEIKYEWSRVPHFYYFFYVYMYATSICASTYIVNEILKGNEEVRKKYLKFLTLGGSMYPIDELKEIGIDMTDKKIIKETIDYFSEILNQIKEIDS